MELAGEAFGIEAVRYKHCLSPVGSHVLPPVSRLLVGTPPEAPADGEGLQGPIATRPLCGDST